MLNLYCILDTDVLLQALSGRSFNGSVSIPGGGPFACANPVTVLSGVGKIVARTLLRIPAFCADFLKDRSDHIPEGLRLPVAVRTGQAHVCHAPPVPLHTVNTKGVVGAMQ